MYRVLTITPRSRSYMGELAVAFVTAFGTVEGIADPSSTALIRISIKVKLWRSPRLTAQT